MALFLQYCHIDLARELSESQSKPGLNIDFDESKGRVISRQALPPLNEVFAEARREERKRLVMLDKKGDESAPVEKSALIASQEVSAYKIQGPRVEDKPQVWCNIPTFRTTHQSYNGQNMAHFFLKLDSYKIHSNFRVFHIS